MRNKTWIVFDTETSGAYPIASEIVEVGAIKYFELEEVDRLEVLIRPRKPIPKEIIAIHNISNEMLESCPTAEDVAPRIREFFESDFVVAHHAPFDMGFMAYFFESLGLSLPKSFGLCTSLLGRKLLHDVTNHKLQTLASHYGISSGAAHRALDDARTCSEIFKVILSKLPERATKLEQVKQIQGYKLSWDTFSLKRDTQIKRELIRQAICSDDDIQIIYNKGNFRGVKRKIKPLGIVLSPLDGNYVPAWCYIDLKKKRFMLDQIQEVEMLHDE